MCSIFGSTSREEFFNLAKLNQYRGTHSHSVAVLRSSGSFELIQQGFGPLEEIELPDNCLYIGHQQAPTTDAKDVQSIHPAKVESQLLWHNGIIKSHIVKKWQDYYNSGEKWDTKLLLVHIFSKGLKKALTEADGSFACLYHDLDHLYLFRNDNSPMFVKGSTFSSTKFEEAESLQSNQVFNYNVNTCEFEKTNISFETANLFYWSPE